jgi:ubiquitin carboxyl-terminal hydrolase 48
MERKKSKHTISFPTFLDMNRFMGSTTQRETAADNTASSNMYELKGVILHKGPSAHHGHYEAQVFDSGCVSIERCSERPLPRLRKQTWFQFNDETVTEIKVLGDNETSTTSIVDIEADNNVKWASFRR